MTKSTWALVALALFGGLFVLFQIATRTPEPPSHQVFIGGAVLTMNTEQPIAEAVSVRGDRIEAVGATDEIMALVSEETEVTDLMGRTLIPGFIDAHGHFPGSGLYSLVANLSSPPVGSVIDMDMLVERLKEQAARTEEGDWIIGLSYDDTAIEEGRHPTRSDLDRVSETQPVVALHSSLHFASVNSAALDRLGINRATPDPAGGVIVRDEQGEPTGVLEENAMMSLMGEVLNFGAFDGFLMAKAAVKDYAQHGVTTANMGAGSREQMEGMRLMSKWGVVPQRLTVMPLQTDFDQDIKAGTFNEVEWDTDLFDTVGFKIVADGSIQGYTGYLSHPYHVPFKGDDSYRGYARVAREALFEQVRDIFKHGYHVAIHTNGDESIQDALDAVEAALSEFPREDHRTILIHAQMAREDQIQRIATLGITPSFFTAHVYFWGDRHRDIFMGPERAENISPSQWAIENGVRFTTHLDTPVVPMRPLRAVSAMANRKTSSGDVLGEYQKTDVMTALRATTIDAAWQVRREADLGSIEVGKLADLVVLSGNPLDNVEQVHDLKVERTIIGGVTIYER